LPQHLFDRIWLVKKRLKKSALKPHKLLRFEVPICEHCNLNCKGCGAFSPLVKEHCIDTAEYERDCARLSLLCGGIVEYVDLLGGEPLLHPEILKIIEITRRYFNGAINIITNGIKLPSMTEEFWLSCKKNDVSIVISGYPIRLDHEKIKQMAGDYGVNLEIRGFGRKLTIWNKFPLDLDGSQNPVNNFLSCFPSNFCLHLEHGKIATCGQPFVIRHFNTYFNRNIAVSEEDFIDIYKASSLDEILLFLSRPIPFCKYCGIKKIKRGIKWDISKKEISEWV
jgi:MoaA/NifB/PqqE/SkfB family radical SAM enzyme